MTGCTYGKGNLIHLDYGKNAFTFYRRSDGKAIRVVTRSDAWDDVTDSKHQLLRAKIQAGTATPEENHLFQQLHHERSQRILARPLESLFNVTFLENAAVPARARLNNSVTCAGCGEEVMETRSRLFRGQSYCIPCFETRDRRFEG